MISYYGQGIWKGWFWLLLQMDDDGKRRLSPEQAQWDRPKGWLWSTWGVVEAQTQKKFESPRSSISYFPCGCVAEPSVGPSGLVRKIQFFLFGCACCCFYGRVVLRSGTAVRTGLSTQICQACIRRKLPSYRSKLRDGRSSWWAESTWNLCCADLEIIVLYGRTL